MLNNSLIKKIILSSVIGLTTVTTQISAKGSGTNVTKLKNGLDIVTFESNKVPLVTICLTFKAGGMTETPELNGLTHLWEHMFFKGNKKIPTQEGFRRRIRQLGITYNGDTSAEKVRYYFTLPSAFLEEGLSFMADAIRTPNLSQEELEKERVVVLNEYQRSASSPSFLSRNARRKVIYGAQEHQRDPLGKRETIMATTRDHLYQIKREVFVPANGSIIIGGNIETKKAVELSRKYFGDWKNPKGWIFPKNKPLPNFPKSQSLNFSSKLTQDAKLLMTYQGPKARINPKDTYAADMLIGLLRQRTGKFYKKFIQSGETLDAGMYYHTQSHTGEINFYSQHKPELSDKVKKLLLDEIVLWTKDGYFNPTQLEDVKRGLVIQHKMDTAKPSEYVKTLAFWWAVTGVDYYNNYIPNLNKVTVSDIQKFVKKYLIKKPHIDTVLYNTNDAAKLKIKLNGDKYVKENLKEYL